MSFYIIDKNNKKEEIKNTTYSKFVKSLEEGEYKHFSLKSVDGKRMCVYWKIGDKTPSIAHTK